MNTFTVIDTTNDMMPMLDTIATQHRKNGNKLESLVSKKKTHNTGQMLKTKRHILPIY